MSAWRFPRLVRVRWKNRRTRRVRTFVAGVTAHSEQDAIDIGDCVVGCMIPRNQPLNIVIETAVIAREARQADMHSEHTFWERVDGYAIGEPEPKRLKG